MSFPHAVPCQEALSFWEKHRKAEFHFVVHIPQTPKTACWMGSLMRPPPTVHSPISQWERRRQQWGAGSGDQALPFLCIWPQMNITSREKPGICVPAMPPPSGPQCQCHPTHHRVASRVFWQPLQESICPTPSLPRRSSKCVIFLSQDTSGLIQI